ncbi:hypothetical protein [[Limnothrix rosea] IAM M-220]|uniref:hypothetical protein n=1 Tax=[Limnothrix rosea] IAM M-220 TaxID=454133 RepID=UPI000964BD5D|nr:hypothetical protein [[Limnothrix rosea] IAM M-220]OKH15182.1 hypothetical protein NIES208_12975 [[Limnothrix rosea] IAM M-220]
MTTISAKTSAYQEIVDFLAKGTTPEMIINFQVTDETKEKVADLIFAEKNKGLSKEEKEELDHFLLLEHLVRLAKAKARQYIAVEQKS